MFKPVFKEFSVGKYNALTLYNYDELIQEKLYQFKGCFDIELGTVFIEYFRLYLKIKYWGYIVVPAPSYSSKDEERGFNHVDVMFSSLGLEMVKCIHKVKDIKQADLNFDERQQIGNALIIDKTMELRGKKILIVDDVFTTGSTVRAMINLLEKNKPKKIKILVMSKTLSPQEKGL